jgi:TetR/AcrR family transcriptional regulator, transcriptional repressor for nem operon
MARPREFEESAMLDAVTECFWRRGFEATSVRDLMEATGLTAASLYNAFGDKQALYRQALDHYVERSIAHRIRRCEQLAPRAALEAFFTEILRRSLTDREHRGCLLVNAALDVAPNDPAFQRIVAAVLTHIEGFFSRCIERGQADGTISRSWPARELAHHFLGVLMGVRVLARVRPERAVLEGVVLPALGLLDPEEAEPAAESKRVQVRMGPAKGRTGRGR